MSRNAPCPLLWLSWTSWKMRDAFQAVARQSRKFARLHLWQTIEQRVAACQKDLALVVDIYRMSDSFAMPSSILLSSIRISCCFTSFLLFENVDQVDIHLKKNKSASLPTPHNIYYCKDTFEPFYTIHSSVTNIKIWDKIKSKRMWPLKGEWET